MIKQIKTKNKSMKKIIKKLEVELQTNQANPEYQNLYKDTTNGKGEGERLVKVILGADWSTSKQDGDLIVYTKKGPVNIDIKASRIGKNAGSGYSNYNYSGITLERIKEITIDYFYDLGLNINTEIKTSDLAQMRKLQHPANIIKQYEVNVEKAIKNSPTKIIHIPKDPGNGNFTGKVIVEGKNTKLVLQNVTRGKPKFKLF